MKIYLAPMEGVVDAGLRALYTQHGHYDLCFTEFIRVTNQLIPVHVFERECAEMKTGFKTLAGCPVRIQLLGGDAACLADNAAQVASFGSPGVDLNFGCPAPTVNRHDGGASLLQFPERIFKIVEAVRKAVPAELPVTAKIRLGFMDTALCLQNAAAVAAAGASELTVHCRTKKQMYQPPVDWAWLPKIREVAPIPLVVNGDVWTAEDYHQCREISGCENVMIGRGALSNPFLVSEIRGLKRATHFDEIRPLLWNFFEINRQSVSGAFAVARGKQWLRYLTRNHAEARTLFQALKVLKEPNEFGAALQEQAPHLSPVDLSLP